MRISQDNIPKWLFKFCKLPEFQNDEKQVVGPCNDPMCEELGCYRNIVDHEDVKHPCIKMFAEPYNYTPKWAYRIDRFSLWMQGILQKIGIHLHNFVRDECCEDFKCCSAKYEGTDIGGFLDELSGSAKKGKNFIVWGKPKGKKKK